ncbi:Putative Actin family, ATPase, nucleotide binding domain-containing protein [Septoria linicola]|uniref:Actin family, ATPase, nucleotide binding domain-containing protein n=1 Tax=Septoria linicola TaxID=215465 RepID=A0A9Q9B3J7_9PEZI|nr:putative Actin family, ATPase, nucleotide binding domain-containing protein [Septoria linicola]USW55676.1 Putative Actin family, ATPase, nucleotide binding domain-containing protein [Septoria linicola]
MPPFRDDQIFIIAPGSQTTLAQLGLPESFTPARYRLRSRMFPGEQKGEYEPIKIRKKEKAVQSTENGPTNGESKPESPEWEEDRISEEGAIWPIQNGSIVDWPCFYALLDHVYNTVNPPFHTPILLIAEPTWTHKEYEKVAQFIFEKFKTPALAMMDSAVATTYAYGIPTATVVDVGLNKADVSCVVDFMLQDVGRGIAVPDCGGNAMTDRLVELLAGRKGFNRDVCEQLKRSPICEILAADIELPDAEAGATNPAAAASTGAAGAAPGPRKPSIAGDQPLGPGPDTQVGEEKKLEDEEGVLDVASIVTSGNMSEYLAQKEKEKQEKAAAKQRKPSEAQQQANKPARLPNAKRPRNTFVYEDFALHDAMKKAGKSTQELVDMQTALDDNHKQRQKTPEPQSAISDKPADAGFDKQDGTTENTPTGGLRREIEVGPERFQAASGGILDRLADAIHRTVLSCGEIGKRSELWDSLIILGNGSKVRGFKEALISTLQAKYIISPSSATIFTSELPSNFSTPIATGANTPQPGQQSQHGGVNPLLHAALTAQNPQLHPSQSALGHSPMPQGMHSSGHGQTPTSIKTAKIPEYFPEWKEVGYEEATFLGAQVAGKLLFIVDGGASKGYMTRTDYNDQGPSGIHDVRM